MCFNTIDGKPNKLATKLNLRNKVLVKMQAFNEPAYEQNLQLSIYSFSNQCFVVIIQ